MGKDKLDQNGMDYLFIGRINNYNNNNKYYYNK
jgi:hypothetical protein